jgi:hypothetical protein
VLAAAAPDMAIMRSCRMTDFSTLALKPALLASVQACWKVAT